MAIDLPSLIFDVRGNLSDIPVDYTSDSQLYSDLKAARDFVSMVACPDVTEDKLTICIVRLATYYSYVNYTSLAERNLGTVPNVATSVRVNSLRTIAVSFLQQVACVPLSDDLTLDTTKMERIAGLAFTVTKSVLE